MLLCSVLFKGRSENSRESDLVAEVSFDVLLFLEDMILHFKENCSCSEGCDAVQLFIVIVITENSL